MPMKPNTNIGQFWTVMAFSGCFSRSKKYFYLNKYHHSPSI